MNKLKVITVLAIGLFIINLVLIGVNYIQKTPKREGPRNEIIQRLQFDEQQIKAYDTMIQQHRKAIRQLDNEILELKKSLYKQLTSKEDLIAQDALLNSLGEKQKALEQVHFEHFKQIHQLCKPSQEAYFLALTYDLQDLFPRRNMKPKN
jgi:hypothetical protein